MDIRIPVGKVIKTPAEIKLKREGTGRPYIVCSEERCRQIAETLERFFRLRAFVITDGAARLFKVLAQGQAKDLHEALHSRFSKTIQLFEHMTKEERDVISGLFLKALSIPRPINDLPETTYQVYLDFIDEVYEALGKMELFFRIQYERPLVGAYWFLEATPAIPEVLNGDPEYLQDKFGNAKFLVRLWSSSSTGENYYYVVEDLPEDFSAADIISILADAKQAKWNENAQGNTIWDEKVFEVSLPLMKIPKSEGKYIAKHPDSVYITASSDMNYSRINRTISDLLEVDFRNDSKSNTQKVRRSDKILDLFATESPVLMEQLSNAKLIKKVDLGDPDNGYFYVVSSDQDLNACEVIQHQVRISKITVQPAEPASNDLHHDCSSCPFAEYGLLGDSLAEDTFIGNRYYDHDVVSGKYDATVDKIQKSKIDNCIADLFKNGGSALYNLIIAELAKDKGDDSANEYDQKIAERVNQIISNAISKKFTPAESIHLSITKPKQFPYSPVVQLNLNTLEGMTHTVLDLVSTYPGRTNRKAHVYSILFLHSLFSKFKYPEVTKDTEDAKNAENIKSAEGKVQACHTIFKYCTIKDADKDNNTEFPQSDYIRVEKSKTKVCYYRKDLAVLYGILHNLLSINDNINVSEDRWINGIKDFVIDFVFELNRADFLLSDAEYRDCSRDQAAALKEVKRHLSVNTGMEIYRLHNCLYAMSKNAVAEGACSYMDAICYIIANYQSLKDSKNRTDAIIAGMNLTLEDSQRKTAKDVLDAIFNGVERFKNSLAETSRVDNPAIFDDFNNLVIPKDGNDFLTEGYNMINWGFFGFTSNDLRAALPKLDLDLSKAGEECQCISKLFTAMFEAWEKKHTS